VAYTKYIHNFCLGGVHRARKRLACSLHATGQR